MPDTSKQIEQLRPGTATPNVHTLYTVPASTTAVGLVLRCTNITASDCWVTVWNDADGSDATDDEVIYDEIDIPPHSTTSFGIGPLQEAATIRVAVETANAINFTLYGTERT